MAYNFDFGAILLASRLRLSPATRMKVTNVCPQTRPEPVCIAREFVEWVLAVTPNFDNEILLWLSMYAGFFLAAQAGKENSAWSSFSSGRAQTIVDYAAFPANDRSRYFHRDYAKHSSSRKVRVFCADNTYCRSD